MPSKHVHSSDVFDPSHNEKRQRSFLGASESATLEDTASSAGTLPLLEDLPASRAATILDDVERGHSKGRTTPESQALGQQGPASDSKWDRGESISSASGSDSDSDAAAQPKNAAKDQPKPVNATSTATNPLVNEERQLVAAMLVVESLKRPWNSLDAERADYSSLDVNQVSRNGTRRTSSPRLRPSDTSYATKTRCTLPPVRSAILGEISGRDLAAVTFVKETAAAEAAKSLNGVKFNNRPLKVEVMLNQQNFLSTELVKSLSDRVSQPKNATKALPTPATDPDASRRYDQDLTPDLSL
ncbi:uncharacterized protein BDZ99DRAFT_525846 [Mytilinidion resinicola]|uniref:RRM domain-containing protein n=1 Tax=Mytilinidion resinicola TaxID=574789 RepID=A0A6A6Y6L8_9PEZI|nr:uncharacterized protein BDZ99DRAFT_525846 [Mytilinidion resinicola]KAF2804249.1 hypothetical protein BDZ99DRAFT_525846 [Mytilinidion resinicola]